MPTSVPRLSGDADLVAAAIDAAATVGIVDPRTGARTARGFARRVLSAGDASVERVVRRWEAGDAPLPPIARAVCLAIVRRPRLALELERVNRIP